MTTKFSKAQIEESRADLLRNVKPGDTIYTILRHRSRSGMYRAIDLYVVKDGAPFRISWDAAALLEGYDEKHEACRASGAGMDMGFHLVYNLAHRLFGDGYALTQSWL